MCLASGCNGVHQTEKLHVQTDSLTVYHWILNALSGKVRLKTKASSEMLIRDVLTRSRHWLMNIVLPWTSNLSGQSVTGPTLLSPAYIHATVCVCDATQPSRTNPFTTGPRTLSRRYPDLAILSSHLTNRTYLRAHSQAEVTPQNAFSPDATTK